MIREVQPAFMLSHSSYDPYNTDHMYATQVALECRMIAQAWGHDPGEKVLGAPQLYLFEPHQTEQMGWKPDTFLDITPVWEKKRAAIECMEGQEHLWDYYTRVAQNAPTTSSATPAARRAGATAAMPRASSRSSRAPWTSSDERRRGPETSSARRRAIVDGARPRGRRHGARGAGADRADGAATCGRSSRARDRGRRR